MTRSRRAVVRLGVLAVAISAMAVPGGQAQAATVSIPVDCTGAIRVTANIGDTLVFTFVGPACATNGSFLDNTDGTGPGFLSYVENNDAGDVFEDTGSNWVNMGDGPPTNSLIRWKYEADGGLIEVEVTLSATNVNGISLVEGAVIGQLSPGSGTYDITWNSPNSGGTGSPVPAVPMQGVPIPASGACSDVDETQLTWGSTIHGGWSKSWQPWVNATAPEGQGGGFACIRSIRWTPSGWTATQ